MIAAVRSLLRLGLAVAIAAVLTAASLIAVARMAGPRGSQPPSKPRPILAVEVAPPPPAPEPIEPALPRPATLASSAATTPSATKPPASEPAALAPATGDGAATDLGLLPPLGLPLGPITSAGLGTAPGAPSGDAHARDEPARPIARPAPSYPRDAQRAGIEGFVVVRLHVDARGRVDDVVVVQSEPAEVFDTVAIRTARSYRFEPARRDGRAIASTIEQRIVFRLQR
ncbi:MAG: TonB family protein [Nannocystaceae bacterium]|nr:TonB family protein [Nannocystaceae bacterium]